MPLLSFICTGVRLELAPTMHAAAVRATFPTDKTRGMIDPVEGTYNDTARQYHYMLFDPLFVLIP